jgi:hypothetical protein
VTPETSEALVGKLDPEGVGVCDGCRKQIAIDLPTNVYHRYRLCTECFLCAFPEAAEARVSA